MRKRTFSTYVTVKLNVEVLATDDVDHDRMVAHTFSRNYGNQLGLRSIKARELYDDPVDVTDVVIGDYPTHISDREVKDEVPSNAQGSRRGGPVGRRRGQTVHDDDAK